MLVNTYWQQCIIKELLGGVVIPHVPIVGEMLFSHQQRQILTKPNGGKYSEEELRSFDDHEFT